MSIQNREFLRGFSLAAKRIRSREVTCGLLENLRIVKGTQLEGRADGLEVGLMSALGIL